MNNALEIIFTFYFMKLKGFQNNKKETKISIE